MQGRYNFKLLAVDVPSAVGGEQRIFLQGDEAVYSRGGVLAELRDPFTRVGGGCVVVCLCCGGEGGGGNHAPGCVVVGGEQVWRHPHKVLRSVAGCLVNKEGFS